MGRRCRCMGMGEGGGGRAAPEKPQRDSSLRDGRSCLPRKLPLPGTFARGSGTREKAGRHFVQNDAAWVGCGTENSLAIGDLRRRPKTCALRSLTCRKEQQIPRPRKRPRDDSARRYSARECGLAAGGWGDRGYLDCGGVDYAVGGGHLGLGGGGHGAGHGDRLFRELGYALLRIQYVDLFVGRGEEGPAAGVACGGGCGCGGPPAGGAAQSKVTTPFKVCGLSFAAGAAARKFSAPAKRITAKTALRRLVMMLLLPRPQGFRAANDSSRSIAKSPGTRNGRMRRAGE